MQNWSEGTKLSLLLVIIKKIVAKRSDFQDLFEETLEAYGSYKLGQIIYY